MNSRIGGAPVLRVPHISDALWTRVQPIIAQSDPGSASEREVDRLLIDAVIYRAVTGADWVDLPSELPHDAGALATYQRWKAHGIIPRLSAALLIDLDEDAIVPSDRTTGQPTTDRPDRDDRTPRHDPAVASSDLDLVRTRFEPR